MADRWQVVEDRNYLKEDCVDVCFWGYVRGSSYRVNGKVHVVGVGDYMIKAIAEVADPCPEFVKVDKPGKGNEEFRTKGDGQNEEEEDGEEDGGEQEEGVKQTVAAPIKRRKRTLNQQ